MNNKLLAGYMVIFFALLAQPGVAQQHGRQLPNIIYILADDLGYGDLSIYNKESKIKTPQIDRMAQQGMRFSDAHTTSGVCTPSRYSILTGQYPWRSRLPSGVLKGYNRTLIEPGQPTVASLLKTGGYTTAVIGKWHLGLDWALKPRYRDSASNRLFGILEELNPDMLDFTQPVTRGPNDFGFDYSYVLPASLDMPPYCYVENGRLTAPLDQQTAGNKLESGYTGPFWRAGKMASGFDFFDVLPNFNRRVTDFIKTASKGDKPFFLYYPMAAPHTPWMPTNGFAGKSAAGQYGDFVEMVDAMVGELMKTIDSLGIGGNTMIIFSSDNGPYWRDNFVRQYNHKAAGPFRGMKGDIFEAGHRVPFIVRYPGQIAANSLSEATISQTSLWATCADIIGKNPSDPRVTDSYSILPVLTGKAKRVAGQSAIVHFSSRGMYAIRKGDWKYISRLGSGGMSTPFEITPKAKEATGQLYNLKKDVHEDHNLFLSKPRKVKQFQKELERIKKSGSR